MTAQIAAANSAASREGEAEHEEREKAGTAPDPPPAKICTAEASRKELLAMSSTSLDSENALMTVTSHATTAAIMKSPVISNQANDADLDLAFCGEQRRRGRHRLIWARRRCWGFFGHHHISARPSESGFVDRAGFRVGVEVERPSGRYLMSLRVVGDVGQTGARRTSGDFRRVRVRHPARGELAPPVDRHRSTSAGKDPVRASIGSPWALGCSSGRLVNVDRRAEREVWRTIADQRTSHDAATKDDETEESYCW